MKFGKVLTYKDVTEAEKLVGKKVISSDVFKEIDTQADILASIGGRLVILTGVVEGNPFPFRVSNGTVYQFIREVIEEESDPHYEPYDLSDPKVRDSLRGEWFRDTGNDGDPETMVFFFCHNESGWRVNNQYYADSFLRECVWVDDGTPCGRLMNMEVR